MQTEVSTITESLYIEFLVQGSEVVDVISYIEISMKRRQSGQGRLDMASIQKFPLDCVMHLVLSCVRWMPSETGNS